MSKHSMETEHVTQSPQKQKTPLPDTTAVSSPGKTEVPVMNSPSTTNPPLLVAHIYCPSDDKFKDLVMQLKKNMQGLKVSNIEKSASCIRLPTYFDASSKTLFEKFLTDHKYYFAWGRDPVNIPSEELIAEGVNIKIRVVPPEVIPQDFLKTTFPLAVNIVSRVGKLGPYTQIFYQSWTALQSDLATANSFEWDKKSFYTQTSFKAEDMGLVKLKLGSLAQFGQAPTTPQHVRSVLKSEFNTAPALITRHFYAKDWKNHSGFELATSAYIFASESEAKDLVNKVLEVNGEIVSIQFVQPPKHSWSRSDSRGSSRPSSRPPSRPVSGNSSPSRDTSSQSSWSSGSAPAKRLSFADQDFVDKDLLNKLNIPAEKTSEFINNLLKLLIASQK